MSSFSSASAVLLNCFYQTPRVLPFPSDSPPHPPGEGGGVRKQLRGSVLPAEGKPQHTGKNTWGQKLKINWWNALELMQQEAFFNKSYAQHFMCSRIH